MIKMSGTVGSVLKRKGSKVWLVTPDQTVYEAIERMTDKGEGALFVIRGKGCPDTCLRTTEKLLH